MKRCLVDSGIASNFINDRNAVRDKAKAVSPAGCRIGIPTVVMGELRGGIECSQTATRNRKQLQRELRHFTLWPFDKRAAEFYGRIYAELRRIGRPMQQIDIQVAAVALALGSTTVVTKDSDLAAVPGLNVTDWAGDTQ